MVLGLAAVDLRSLRFKILSVIAIVMNRRVTYHHAGDVFVPSLDIIKKNYAQA